MYLAELDLEKGMIAYSIEDENGDRLDKVIVEEDYLRNLTIVDMDMFLLSYLPKLMSKGYNLKIMGPISKSLADMLDDMQLTLIRAGIHPFGASTLSIMSIEEVEDKNYGKDDIVQFAKKYLENRNLSETMKEVFKYYR